MHHSNTRTPIKQRFYRLMRSKAYSLTKNIILGAPLCIALAASTSALAQVKILPLGDSITQGTRGQQSYRKPLVEELNLSGCGFEMVGSRSENNIPTGFISPHEGYSGHNTDFFTEGSPQANPANPGIDAIMDAENPDIVLVHLGSNDITRSRPVLGPYLSNGNGGTVAEIERLVTQIWNSNADAEIFVANVIPWFGASNNPNVAADIVTLGDEIESWIDAENDPRLHLVDVRSGFNINLMTSDGIHPNADGDAHIADAFLSVMDEAEVCSDGAPPATFISSPAAAGASVSITHTYTGTATDTGGAGFDRVRIAIEDNNDTDGSGQWFNFATGTFGRFSSTVATLSNVTESSLDWNFTATLPSGNYTLYALAIDNDGNQDFNGRGFWPTNRRFVVPSDSQTPSITIDTPSANDITLPANASFSGSATDAGGSGFNDVRLAIRNQDINQWYNFSNNSFSGAVGNGSTTATLTNTTTTDTDWNFTTTLPSGEYSLFIIARDNAGNTSSFSIRRFSIAPDDTQSPVTNIDTPSANSVVLPANASFSGSATDAGGSGFNDVRLAIRNQDINQWYNFGNNSFSGAVGNGSTTANLTNTTITDTNWNYSVTLPAGEYSLFVAARDKAGNTSSFSIRRFSIAPDDTQSPTTTIDSPSASNVALPANASFSGSAADAGGSGFNDVRLAIRNQDINQWYNFSNNSFSGAIGNGSTAADLTNTTNTATDWNFNVALPSGEYSLFIIARDNSGNTSSFNVRRFSILSDDVQSPTTTIATPSADNITLPANATFTGSASDAGGSGFNDVRLAIRNQDINQWYNFGNNTFSGAVGNGSTPTNLTNTSITDTDWNLTATLPAGQYTLYIIARDNFGNTSSFNVRRFSIQ